MKFDKDIVTGIVICIALVLLSPMLGKWLGLGPQQSTATTETVNAPVVSSPAAPATATGNTVPAAVADAAKIIVPAPGVPEYPPQELSNDDLTLTFSPNTGALTGIRLNRYYRNGSKGDPNGVLTLSNQAAARAGLPHPGALGLFEPAGWRVADTAGNDVLPVGEAVKDEYRLRRRIVNGAGREFDLEQSWKLAGGYLIDYTVTIANPSDQPLVLNNLSVDGGDLSDWNVLSGDNVRNPKHTIDFVMPDNSFTSVDVDDKSFDEKVAHTARWVAVSNKYLSVILRGDTPFDIMAGQEKVTDGKQKKGYYLVGVIGARYPTVTVAPHESSSLKFTYFVGPKIAADLEMVEDSALDVMHLAWGPLDWLSKLLLKFLLFFHEVVGSYGISIIILTVVVRLLFWPISMKANRSMAKMKKLQPKLAEINAKYKSDPTTLRTKQMELYREEGVNPFGGCLPILLQIPVFIALYQTLESAVQLRQESFLWIQDLSAPDTIGAIFGIPIHPLALAMTGLMVLQQQLTPVSVEGMQKKMMMLMPVVMLFILYNLPSGLTLYWTVSSLFSIGQMQLQRSMDKKHVAAADAPPVKK